MSPVSFTGAIQQVAEESRNYHSASGIAVLALFCFLTLQCPLTTAQSIIRSSLSSIGTAVSEEGIIFRQTVGQSSNTFIFRNGGICLLQGFQQPISGTYLFRPMDPVDFTLYPNPAMDNTWLVLGEEMKSYTITIYNLSGTPLSVITGYASQSVWLDLKNYPVGIYIIKVTSGIRTGSKRLILNH
ncbi:MAG TPA: T9SS type A sorting domain-containing protein [Bacteroidales bacterium]|jgi:hypothetical protein|nr:T9SS type A sorting domain-containing protein [Bacteroidales bacterium]